jgi:hypothetical protein
MKKHLRRIALLLAVLIALSSVLVACKGDDDDDDKDGGGWELGTEGKSATPDNIPEDTDFEGYEFKVLHRAHDWLLNYECKGNIEGEVVNPVHRTVYERNMRVQARLNCKIKYIATQSGSLAETGAEIRNHQECAEENESSTKVIHYCQETANNCGISNKQKQIPFLNNAVHGGSTNIDKADLAQFRRLNGQ